jgi:hypothetical protein
VLGEAGEGGGDVGEGVGERPLLARRLTTSANTDGAASTDRSSSDRRHPGIAYRVRPPLDEEKSMKLLSYGLAVGLGYLLGRPDGRERLAQVGRQAADLAQRPEVVRLRERGKDVATERVQAVKQKVVARSKNTDSPGSGPDSPTGGAEAASDAGFAAARPRRGLRALSWRPSFSRSRGAHFPPSENLAPPTALGGTTVMEDSEAAILGMPVASHPESPTPPTDRS